MLYNGDNFLNTYRDIHFRFNAYFEQNKTVSYESFWAQILNFDSRN